MTTPAEREFALLSRGFIRDKVVLANFREGLRSLTNPETGAIFTEEEIQRATQPGSRWYNEAQAIDDYAQSEQRKGAYLADQIIPTRAAGSWVALHAALWGVPRLPAAGGEMPVLVTATSGTIVVGSTTPNDPLAYKSRDAAGNLYQVKTSATVAAAPATTVSVTMFALSTGAATNLVTGTVLTWTYKAPAMQPTATVTATGVGGRDLETEAAWAERIEQRMREDESAGNDAQMRRWTKEASSAIEDAFIYPCAFYANSVLIAITQVRGATLGPLARQPSVDTLAAATSRMVPPGSPVVPADPLVVVTGFNSEVSDLHLGISMPRGSSVGWADASPFPTRHATAPSITTVTAQTDIRITCPGDATLPGQAALTTLTGANAPRLMVWDATTSRFVALSIAWVEDLGSNVFRVALTSAPAGLTLATGQWVCPYTERHLAVAQAVERYFDRLGPGQLVDPATDPRASRTIRYPDVVDEWPTDVTSELATQVVETLGGAGAGASLISATKTTPRYTALADTAGDITAGPWMLTLGKLGVYATT